jgi:hypothetical protein
VRKPTVGVVAAIATEDRELELRLGTLDGLPPAAAYLAPTRVAELLDVVLALAPGHREHDG